MAYLNEEEREKLLNQLVKMDFKKAKRKLRSMDKEAKLRLYRTNHSTGKWVTRYDLVTLGTSVTLVEERVSGYIGSPNERQQNVFQLTEVYVEPLSDNQT